MLIDEMHYEFKLLFNNIDSQDDRILEKWEIDQYLNMAIRLKFIEKYVPSKLNKNSFESVQKRISELETLHIKSPEKQPGLVPFNLGGGRYELMMDSLGNNVNTEYYRVAFPTKIYLDISKNGCVSKMIEGQIVEIDDRKTKYTEPSFKWKRASCNFGMSTYKFPHTTSSIGDPDFTINLFPSSRFNHDKLNSLYIDTNDMNNVSQFKVDKVYVSYLRYPNRVFSGGYDHIDQYSNDTDAQIHCDLPEWLHSEIIRSAVKLAKTASLNQLGFQLDSEQVTLDKLI